MLFSTKKIHIQSFISLLGHPLDHLVNFSQKSEHAVFDDRRRDRRERDNVIIKHHITLAIMLCFIDVERGERISEHRVEPLCTLNKNTLLGSSTFLDVERIKKILPAVGPGCSAG